MNEQQELKKVLILITRSLYPQNSQKILRKVYLLTRNKDGYCYLPQKQLAEQLGISRRSLQRHLERFLKDGVLSVELRAGYYKQNRYYFHSERLCNLNSVSPLERKDGTATMRLYRLEVKRELKKLSCQNGLRIADYDAAKKMFNENRVKTFSQMKAEVEALVGQNRNTAQNERSDSSQSRISGGGGATVSGTRSHMAVNDAVEALGCDRVCQGVATGSVEGGDRVCGGVATGYGRHGRIEEHKNFKELSSKNLSDIKSLSKNETQKQETISSSELNNLLSQYLGGSSTSTDGQPSSLEGRGEAVAAQMADNTPEIDSSQMELQAMMLAALEGRVKYRPSSQR